MKFGIHRCQCGTAHGGSVREDRKAGRIRPADLPDDYDYGKNGEKKMSKRSPTIEIFDEEEGEDTDKRRDRTDHGDASNGEGIEH